MLVKPTFADKAWKILTEVCNFTNLSLDQATGVEESVSQS